jgi:predicted secreted protein
MATTGKENGTLIKIYVGATAIAHSTSCSLELAMATRDVTTKDSAGWKETGSGLRNWSMSGDYLFAEDAGYGFDDLFGLINARTLVTVVMSSAVSGDKKYNGSAYLTSVSREAPMEETVSGSYTFEGTGVLVESAIT